MKKALALIMLLCALATHARSQVNSSRADVGAAISTSHNLGYQDPNLGITLRLLLKPAPRFAIESRFDFIARAHKYTGDGHGYIFKADAHAFLVENISIVPGMAYRRQVTKQFTSQEFNPSVGLAYWRDNFRLQAQYEFPDWIGEHRTRAVVISAESIFHRKGYYIAARPELSIARFDQAGRGVLTGYRGGVSISVGKRLSD